MAVRIRLTRVGATKRPAYRVIAIDKRRSRDGRALEILGFYDPLTEPATVQLETSEDPGLDRQGRAAVRHGREAHAPVGAGRRTGIGRRRTGEAEARHPRRRKAVEEGPGQGRGRQRGARQQRQRPPRPSRPRLRAEAAAEAEADGRGSPSPSRTTSRPRPERRDRRRREGRGVKDFLEYVAKALVDKPEAVEVEVDEEERRDGAHPLCRRSGHGPRHRP